MNIMKDDKEVIFTFPNLVECMMPDIIINIKKARLINEVLTEDEKDVIKYYRLFKADGRGKMRLVIADGNCFIDATIQDKIRLS